VGLVTVFSLSEPSAAISFVCFSFKGQNVKVHRVVLLIQVIPGVVEIPAACLTSDDSFSSSEAFARWGDLQFLKVLRS